ncbi:MAG TPA: MOSC domain-containing protein [Armatimonadota bacterium]|jgi:MOSC domain-containing protein YiiM
MEHAVSARIVGLQVSDGGVPKLPVEAAVVTPTGLVGDRQRNLVYHGGPERALCLYSLERIQSLQAEGHPIVPGAAGENVTLEGLDWSTVVPGRRYRLGAEVTIEITSYTTPCQNIAPSFAEGDYGRISQKTHPGDSRVYARVLRTGTVRVGDPVEAVEA